MSGILDIRPGDRRAAFGAVAALFTLHVAHGLLETARDTLFLARVPATVLPWTGLIIAIAALVVGRLAPASDRTDRQLFRLLVAAVAITAGFYPLTASSGRLVPIALFVWINLFAFSAISRAWLLVGLVFTSGQAKRLYPIVGAGALVGSASGSLLASRLLAVVGARPLLLAGAAALAVSAVVFKALLRVPPAPPAVEPRRAGARLIQSQPYLRRLILLALATSATVTVVDYLFKSAAAARMSGAELGHFLATMYAVLPATALVFQLGLASFLLRRFGPVATVGALPALLAPLGIAAAVWGAFVPIVMAKAVDGALRASTARVGSELLLTPLPAAVRARFKPLIEAFGTRGGQALASLLVVGLVALGASSTVLAVLAGLLAALWLLSLLGLKRRYLDLFRAGLRHGSELVKGRNAVVEPGTALVLVEALSSDDEEEVCAAMELLAGSKRAALIPSALLYHPSPRVARVALDLLAAAGRDLARVAAPLLAHPDAETRAHAYRLRVARDPADAARALADESPLVRAVALVAILRESPDDAEAAGAAHELARRGSPEARAALARAIGDGGGSFHRLLHELAGGSEPGVLVEVARAIRRLPSRVFLPRLVELLADRELRYEARHAILAIGSPALDYLDACLGDAATPASIRRHIPRTISQFRSARAAAILVRRLVGHEDGAVRFKCLRGLGRMRADRPDLPLDEVAIRGLAGETVKRALAVLAWRLAVAEVEPQPLVEALLAEKERHALERIFRIVALLKPSAELELLHDGVRSGDARARDASVELLGDVLDPAVRDQVLALVDDLPDAQRLKRAGGTRISFGDAVAAMRRDHSPPLRALATQLFQEAA